MKSNYPITTEQYKKLLKKADEMTEAWAKNNPEAQRITDYSEGLKKMLDVIFFAEDEEIFGDK